MEKRNTILLTVIAIATLLVAVVGATFAYFASNINTGKGDVNINVNTSNNKSVFTAESAGSISLNVASYMMQLNNAGDGNNTTSNDTNIANNLVSTANINVNLSASDPGHVTECTYDIVWEWEEDSSDFSETLTSIKEKEKSNGVYPSKYYIRTENNSEEDSSYTKEFKEFTLAGHESVTGAKGDRPETGDLFVEQNIDEFECINGDEDDGNCKKLMLKKGETLATDQTANVVYQFTVKFYNLPTDQTRLMDKTFKAHIGVENVHC